MYGPNTIRCQEFRLADIIPIYVIQTNSISICYRVLSHNSFRMATPNAEPVQPFDASQRSIDTQKDLRYIRDDDIVSVVRIVRRNKPNDGQQVCGGKTVMITLLGYPEIPISVCNGGCGGYRFQPTNSSKCRVFGTCSYGTSYTGKDLEIIAGRYVKRCPMCNRLFVVGIGRSIERNSNIVCYSYTCFERWVIEYDHPEWKCVICGKVCCNKITLTTRILPHLYPDRVFVGDDFNVCRGDRPCIKLLRERVQSELLEQAKMHIADKHTQNDVVDILLQHFKGKL